MKKRKELNALIGLAADGRRKKPAKKGSGHRLLRTEPPASDSESSSEEDEFAAAGGLGPLRQVRAGRGNGPRWGHRPGGCSGAVGTWL